MVDALKNIPEHSLDFKAFCDYLQKSSGITITASKSYLVSARIRNIMVQYDLSSLAELITELGKSNKVLHQEIIDAMTTNETFWFRDGYPFEYFSKVLLPQWNDRPSHEPIRIWSAACSSGQEPYSLAMLCEEYKKTNSFSKRIEILATDLSSNVLAKAKSGQFDKLSIARGLSTDRINQFFMTSSCETQWTVKPNLKQYINFTPINLLDSYTSLGKFDIIFCRNVLIYFTKDTKTDILERMHQCLKPNGLLCLGSSESLAGATPLFSMVNCNPGILYQAK